MATHYLIPLDHSPQSLDALEYILKDYTDETITVLHVIDPLDAGYSPDAFIPSFSEDWYESAKEAANELFSQANDLAEEYDVELKTAIEVGRPSRVIVKYADDDDVDHIVMGSHGRSGVSRILLGSVAETVVRRSPIPVTVVR